jgi:translation elongation factor P/translation initiation factor 5A
METPDKLPITPHNAWLMDYENDMMDGMYIDGDENYAFVHADHDDFEEFAYKAKTIGINVLMMDEDVDMTAFPHLHVVASLAALTVRAAEEILREHNGIT